MRAVFHYGNGRLLSKNKDMKKILFLALMVMTVQTYGAAPDKKNKKKKKNDVEQKAPTVSITTPADTLSYATGMMSTRGLMTYVQKEFGIDTAYMTDFIEGYKDMADKIDDPKIKARYAGMRIAMDVGERILPEAVSQFKDTPNPIDVSLFNSGFVAGVTEDTTLMQLDYAVKLFENALAAKDKVYKEENEKWLAENASKEGVKTTSSGLQYKVIKAGNGEIPKGSSKVKVKYSGKLIDGTEFDSSYKRVPQTSTFRADQVIKGWTEALTMMPVGSTWELYIPQELAYGQRQAGKIKPYSTLIFTVELEGIEKPEVKPEAKTEETGVEETKSAAPATVKKPTPAKTRKPAARTKK